MTLLIFLVLFTAVVAAHFFFARRAWALLRGAHDTEIDLAYVRRDNWLAQSFRERLAQWTSVPAAQEHAKFRVFETEHERVIENDQSRSGSRTANSEIYSFSEDFSCPGDAAFAREISVKGNAKIGPQSRLQAITTGGRLEIGYDSRIRRWADSDGEMVIGPGVTIGARATSRYAIRVSERVRAQMLSAPTITTAGYRETAFDQASVPARGALQFPLVRNGEGPQQAPEAGNGDRLLLMEENCVLHRGDLSFSLPVEIRCRLIVLGSFSCPAGSLLHEDIKAEGGLTVGAESLVKGNLVAGGSLALFDGCVFEGLLHAGGDVLLATGVRGVARRGPVAAYATGTLFVESNVAVEGKLAAGQEIQTRKFMRK